MASNICVCFLPYLAIIGLLEAAGEKEEGIHKSADPVSKSIMNDCGGVPRLIGP